MGRLTAFKYCFVLLIFHIEYSQVGTGNTCSGETDCTVQGHPECVIENEGCNRESIGPAEELYGPPVGVTIKPYLREAQTGFNVSWYLPDKIETLSGFLVEVHNPSGDEGIPDFCTKFTFPNPSWETVNSTDKVAYHYDCIYPVVDNSQYRVSVTSLSQNQGNSFMQHVILNNFDFILPGDDWNQWESKMFIEIYEEVETVVDMKVWFEDMPVVDADFEVRLYQCSSRGCGAGDIQHRKDLTLLHDQGEITNGFKHVVFDHLCQYSDHPQEFIIYLRMKCKSFIYTDVCTSDFLTTTSISADNPILIPGEFCDLKLPSSTKPDEITIDGSTSFMTTLSSTASDFTTSGNPYTSTASDFTTSGNRYTSTTSDFTTSDNPSISTTSDFTTSGNPSDSTNMSTVPPSTTWNKGVIIGLAVAGLVILIAISTSIVCCRHRIFVPKGIVVDVTPSDTGEKLQEISPPPFEVTSVDDELTIKRQQRLPHLPAPKLSVEEPVPEGTKVLIVYSHDFKEHFDVIHEFATFLKENKIHVYLDEFDSEVYHQNQTHWYDSKLKMANRVIIVHSEGAHKKYEAHLRNEHYEDLQHRIWGDWFLKYHRESQTVFQDKVIPVYFSYTDRSYVIPDSTRTAFLLTDSMELLLFQIYRMPSSRPAEKRQIDFVKSNNLELAIAKAGEYVIANPNWFRERYKMRDSGICISELKSTYEDIRYSNPRTTDSMSLTLSIDDQTELTRNPTERHNSGNSNRSLIVTTPSIYKGLCEPPPLHQDRLHDEHDEVTSHHSDCLSESYGPTSLRNVNNIDHYPGEAQELSFPESTAHSCSTGPHSCFTGPHSCSTGPHSCSTDPHSCSTGPHSCSTGQHSCSTGPHSCFTGPHSCFTDPHICLSGPFGESSSDGYYSNGSDSTNQSTGEGGAPESTWPGHCDNSIYGNHQESTSKKNWENWEGPEPPRVYSGDYEELTEDDILSEMDDLNRIGYLEENLEINDNVLSDSDKMNITF